MSGKEKLSAADKALFRQSMHGITPLKQNIIVPVPPRKNVYEVMRKQHMSQQSHHCHYFSDEYQPLLLADDPVRYLRDDVSHDEMKKLRHGDYVPEIFLDLHGLTRHQAKQELGALLAVCRREHLFCASVMHGHGKHILKQQTPWWLAQHPNVMAFHQAPRAWGGDAALLVLIEVETFPHP